MGRATLLVGSLATALLAGCDAERRVVGDWEVVAIDGVGPAIATPLRVAFPAGVYGADTVPADWMWQEYQIDSLTLALQPGGSYRARSVEATRTVVQKNPYVRPDYVSSSFGGDLIREERDPSFEEITGSWTLEGDSLILTQPRDQTVSAVAARVRGALPAAPEGSIREVVDGGLPPAPPPKWTGRVRGDRLELRDPEGRMFTFRKAGETP